MPGGSQESFHWRQTSRIWKYRHEDNRPLGCGEEKNTDNTLARVRVHILPRSHPTKGTPDGVWAQNCRLFISVQVCNSAQRSDTGGSSSLSYFVRSCVSRGTLNSGLVGKTHRHTAQEETGLATALTFHSLATCYFVVQVHTM
jgi:hypothetical protein